MKSLKFLIFLLLISVPAVSQQFSRPDSDINTGGFSLSGCAQGWDCLDDGTTLGYLEYTGADQITYEGTLSDVTDPEVSTGHTIRIYVSAEFTGGSNQGFEIFLYQGATFISYDPFSTQSSGSTLFSFTLSSTEADTITDYSELKVYLRKSSGGAGVRARIFYFELEVPDAPSQRRVITIGENNKEQEERLAK